MEIGYKGSRDLSETELKLYKHWKTNGYKQMRQAYLLDISDVIWIFALASQLENPVTVNKLFEIGQLVIRDINNINKREKRISQNPDVYASEITLEVLNEKQTNI